jgi:hypothetical protein
MTIAGILLGLETGGIKGFSPYDEIMYHDSNNPTGSARSLAAGTINFVIVSFHSRMVFVRNLSPSEDDSERKGSIYICRVRHV